MLTKKKLIIPILILVIILGVPSVSLAGSFVVSLIQGKTPAEAVQVVAEQLDVLFGRVQTLENQQAISANEIELLKAETARLGLQASTTKEKPNDYKPLPPLSPMCLNLQQQIDAKNTEIVVVKRKLLWNRGNEADQACQGVIGLGTQLECAQEQLRLAQEREKLYKQQIAALTEIRDGFRNDYKNNSCGQ